MCQHLKRNKRQTRKQKHDFDQCYQKIVQTSIEKEQNKILNEVKGVQERLYKQQNRQVNPLLDTFDLLYLQEISLRMRKINVPERMRNDKNHKQLIQKRRGGKQKKRSNQKLNDLLLFGIQNKDVGLQRVQEGIHCRVKASLSSKHDLAFAKKKALKEFQGVSIAKIGELWISTAHKLVESGHQINERTNVIEKIVQKKREKQERIHSVDFRNRGSEFYWNPESHHRVKVVKNVVNKLNKIHEVM